MTGIINSNYQHSEVPNSHGGVRMKFWGVCCVGGKAYKQVVNYRFHLTMAVLDPKSYDRDVRDRTVTLSVIQHGQVFALCVLKHGEIQQVNLNLIFDKGDDVTFSVGGYGTVHLTGYQLIDSSDCAFGTDNEHYCPVAELGSEKQIHKRLRPAENGIQTKRKVKVKSKLSVKALTEEIDDDDEDEDDSDFSVEPEEIEESDEDEEYDVEITDDELQGVMQDLKEEVTPPKVEGSQKRKATMSLPEKSTKKEKLDSESEEKDELMSPEKNESDLDEGGLDSSIGHTPMPKLIDCTAKAKKKSKKNKRLSNISMLDKSEKNDGDASQHIATPKKKGVIHPRKKLEGGVEYQDILIGRGPVAEQGKTVSIFYMGRLENKTIFDARVAPKKPFTFKLGVPEVIRGLDIAVKGMRVGGQRRLKIPPGMGYGSKGVNGVPPSSTLYFTVELISVN